MKDFFLTSRYSIVDSSVYLCWGLMDYVMIGFVSTNYGESALITLAVVVSLIEFSVVLDGVGMAMQPLIGTYFGERNHKLIKRLMKTTVRVALIEGVIATGLIWIFSKQFCGLFGIKGGDVLGPSVFAIQIVSLGFAFCSAVSLMTSYYMLIDRIGMATCFACLQNGLFYIILPVAGSRLLGINGMWAGFVIVPILTLITASGFVFLHFGKDNFPFLLKNIDSEIIVMDDTLTDDIADKLSEQVGKSLVSHGFSQKESNRAALFVEEIGLTILEKNRHKKRPIS